MLIGLLVATLTPAAGLLILLVPAGQRTLLGAARTFALAAALGVVVVELLPAAAGDVGAAALLVAVGCFLLPSLLGRGLQATSRRVPALVLSAGSLVLHQVFDGAQMGAASESLGLGVVVAIAAHVAPMVAVTVLSAERLRGRAAGVWVGVVLVLATVLGFFLGVAVDLDSVDDAEPWLRAAIAGFLLHVVGHGMTAQLPERPIERAADLVAAGLGLVVTVASVGGGHVVEVHGEHAHPAFDGALWELTVESAGWVLVGLVVSAALQAVAAGRLGGAEDAGSASVRGAVAGASLAQQHPGTVGSMLPVGRAMDQASFERAVIAAFLFALPAVGLDALFLSVRMLGWPLAALRLVAVLVVAILAGAVFGRLAARPPRPAGVVALGSQQPVFLARWAAAFDELTHHVAPQVTVGLAVAAYVAAFVHPGDVAAWLAAPWAPWALGAASMSVGFGGAGSVPLATVLWADGASPGTTLVFLVLGPGFGVGLLVLLARIGGTTATAAALAVCLTLTVAMGAGVDGLGLEGPLVAPDARRAHSTLDVFATWVLGLALVRSMWLTGPRAWLAGLWGIDTHDHHHHDHEVG